MHLLDFGIARSPQGRLLGLDDNAVRVQFIFVSDWSAGARIVVSEEPPLSMGVTR